MSRFYKATEQAEKIRLLKGRGLDNEAIADRLGISPLTIRKVLKKLQQKGNETA